MKDIVRVLDCWLSLLVLDRGKRYMLSYTRYAKNNQQGAKYDSYQLTYVRIVYNSLVGWDTGLEWVR